MGRVVLQLNRANIFLLTLIVLLLSACTGVNSVTMSSLLDKEFKLLELGMDGHIPVNGTNRMTDRDKIESFAGLIDEIELHEMEDEEYRRKAEEQNGQSPISSYMLTSADERDMDGYNIEFFEDGTVLVMEITDYAGTGFYTAEQTSPSLYQEIKEFYKANVEFESGGILDQL